MNCEAARRVMLEADLSDLTPDAASELGGHLRSCAACRGAAAEIRSLEAGVAAWLADLTPPGGDATAVARAGAAARRRSRTRRFGAAVSLAAAAALGGLLMLPRNADRSAPSPAPLRPAAAPSFAVIAAPGHDVMVLQTADPNIVVVWYLPYRNRRSS